MAVIGFIHVPDDRTIAFADLCGKQQYISTANLQHDARVALSFMDYAAQSRLKVLGSAKILEGDAETQKMIETLRLPNEEKPPERATIIHVEAFDWNCPQHITPRYSEAELAKILEPMGGLSNRWKQKTNAFAMDRELRVAFYSFRAPVAMPPSHSSDRPRWPHVPKSREMSRLRRLHSNSEGSFSRKVHASLECFIDRMGSICFLFCRIGRVRVSHAKPVLLTPGRGEKARLHLRYVDGLRALAAVYVVLGHAWLQTWPGGSTVQRPVGWTLHLTAWLNYGVFAVIFFIAISGFCLMLPVLACGGTLGAGGARPFFFRRARRILPPYYLALLLSIGLAARWLHNVTHSVFDVSLPMTRAGIISHLLLIHNLNDRTANQINLPLWSIAVECQIYLLFPLLVLLRRRFGMPAVLAGTYLVSITIQSFVQNTAFWGVKPLFLFVFALGMYAAEVASGPPREFFKWIGCIAAVIMLSLFQSESLTKLGLTEIVVGVVAMSVLIVCAHWPGNLIARITSFGPIAKIGGFSYSLYLIHFPLQQLIWLYLVLPLKLGKFSTFLVMATVGTGLIIALEFAFYLLFERPFCNMKVARNSGRATGSRFSQVSPS